jgi:RNA polymerase sigma factor (sigma-70 family)
MDETYIQKVLNGDVDSFRYFVSKYKNQSFSVARSIIKSDFDAEEVVQDAFISAFRNLHTFKNKSKFSTWLYRIVLNESLKKLKKKKLQIIDFDESFYEESTVENFDISPIDHLHEEEQKEIINKILDMMPPVESLLLRLFYLAEKDINEMKQTTGLSVSNIKVILFRARKRFATVMEKELKNEINSIL